MTLNSPSTDSPSIPPGWYADPKTPGLARWWSGQDWTNHVQGLPPAVPIAPPSTLLLPKVSSLATRSLVWGIVSVLFNLVPFPSILAIVYGVLALQNGRRLAGHGEAMPKRNLAIAGIVLGAVGLVLMVVFYIGWHMLTTRWML